MHQLVCALLIVFSLLGCGGTPFGSQHGDQTSETITPTFTATAFVTQPRPGNNYYVSVRVSQTRACPDRPDRTCARAPAPNRTVRIEPQGGRGRAIALGVTDAQGKMFSPIDLQAFDVAAVYRVIVDGRDAGAVVGMRVVPAGGATQSRRAEATEVAVGVPTHPRAEGGDDAAEQLLAEIQSAPPQSVAGGEGGAAIGTDDSLLTIGESVHEVMMKPTAESPWPRARIRRLSLVAADVDSVTANAITTSRLSVSIEQGKATVVYRASGWEDDTARSWEPFKTRLANTVYALMMRVRAIEHVSVNVVLPTENEFGERLGYATWIRLECPRATFERMRSTFFAHGPLNGLHGHEDRVLDLIVVRAERPEGAVRQSMFER